MRKREVIELRYRIDCVGRLFTSVGRQQGTVVKRDCEDTPESKSMAYLTWLLKDALCKTRWGNASTLIFTVQNGLPLQTDREIYE